MRWSTGEATIEHLLAEGRIQRVQGAQADGESWLDRARRGLEAARALADSAPDSSVVLAYDAARQACVAVLAQQGLRPTTTGGHYAIEEVVRPSSAPPCEPSAACAADGTSWNTPITRPSRPARQKQPKRLRQPLISSTPPQSSSPTSDSSDQPVMSDIEHLTAGQESQVLEPFTPPLRLGFRRVPELPATRCRSSTRSTTSLSSPRPPTCTSRWYPAAMRGTRRSRIPARRPRPPAPASARRRGKPGKPRRRAADRQAQRAQQQGGNAFQPPNSSSTTTAARAAANASLASQRWLRAGPFGSSSAVRGPPAPPAPAADHRPARPRHRPYLPCIPRSVIRVTCRCPGGQG